MSGRKRSLSGTGGRSRVTGDPELGAKLAHCLAVDPDAKLPFTHGFHSYPARMHPETARRVIEAFPGGRILDPFVGSGTTAVEAVRAGRPFTGFDISKIPLEIAWARTRVGLPEQSRKVENAAHRLSGRAFQEIENEFTMLPWTRKEYEWYDPHTLREIYVSCSRRSWSSCRARSATATGRWTRSIARGPGARPSAGSPTRARN
jgi:hypothetical protein